MSRIANQRNEAQQYYLENFYQNEYNKNADSFSNVDEIFNIADLDEPNEVNDATYDTYQVRSQASSHYNGGWIDSRGLIFCR